MNQDRRTAKILVTVGLVMVILAFFYKEVNKDGMFGALVLGLLLIMAGTHGLAKPN